MEVKTTVTKEVTLNVKQLKEILCREVGFDLSNTQLQDTTKWDNYSQDQEFAGIKLIETTTDENI